jgi:hypothetical protein
MNDMQHGGMDMQHGKKQYGYAARIFSLKCIMDMHQGYAA